MCVDAVVIGMTREEIRVRGSSGGGGKRMQSEIECVEVVVKDVE